MGKVMSVVAGKMQRFNIENRAQKIISQDKPVPAPKYESNIKDLERMLRDHPEFVEEAGKKSSELDDRLKKVFVTSSEYLEQRRIINPDKPLPKLTTSPEDFELGYNEPDPKRVPRGKCTLRQAIQFISDHQQTPTEWTAEKISIDFKMKRENVENILEHFRMFAIHIPKEEGNVKQMLVDPFDKKSSDFEKVLESSKTGKPIK